MSLLIAELYARSAGAQVLNYSVTPAVLTADMAVRDMEVDIQYVTPDPWTQKMLEMLLEGQGRAIRRSINGLERGKKFDVIVCQPPLGVRASKERDGFGGEIVREVVPLLADGGTLYWFTSGGVTFHHRAKETLKLLSDEGVSVAASFQVPSGAFPGTAIEGAIIALRREVLARKFIGAAIRQSAAPSQYFPHNAITLPNRLRAAPFKSL